MDHPRPGGRRRTGNLPVYVVSATISTSLTLSFNTPGDINVVGVLLPSKQGGPKLRLSADVGAAAAAVLRGDARPCRMRNLLQRFVLRATAVIPSEQNLDQRDGKFLILNAFVTTPLLSDDESAGRFPSVELPADAIYSPARSQAVLR